LLHRSDRKKKPEGWQRPVPETPDVDLKYRELCQGRSDINEHLPVLRAYAAKCSQVLECGTRRCTSTWAFLRGLLDSPAPDRELVGCDLNYHDNVDLIRVAAWKSNISYAFILASDTKFDFGQTDLLFIDTWHVYGHLKRELAHLAHRTRKFIILHDTTVDADQGESIRLGWDIPKQSLESGYPESEIAKGVWPAVEEFVQANPDWTIQERRSNNNGLTVLARR
jgi:hypothetical protein